MLMRFYRLIFSVVVCLLTAAFSYAGSDGTKNVTFAYDADFEMNFDNREYYRSSFSRSMTIFAARLAPSVGIRIERGENESHTLLAGVDLLKDFGNSSSKILNEITFNYSLEKSFADTKLSIVAGVFPRSRMLDNYSEAFFSDSLSFYDNNVEGLLVQVRRPRALFEVGCDWMGQYGPENRERFMIFSSGEGAVAPIVSLGYALYVYHFANSYVQKGVVDNVLVNPFVRFDFGYDLGLQDLSLRFGFLQGMQHDRAYVENFVFPRGGEFDFEFKNWNVGVKNSLFYGNDMMPYYNSSDNTGEKYGSRLYFGDPFYRVNDSYSGGVGFYDRFQIFYEPVIKDFLSIRIAALFHFHGSAYSGCRQQVTIKFNLNKLVKK